MTSLSCGKRVSAAAWMSGSGDSLPLPTVAPTTGMRSISDFGGYSDLASDST